MIDSSVEAAPARSPTRPPIQDRLWEAGWGSGPGPHTKSSHVAAAALALVGVRFRPHGRDPRFGLDCVGLAACALKAGGYAGPVPDDYALRHGDGARARAVIDALGLVAGIGSPGELLLCASAPGQVHLAISIHDGLVHADALLRRVVARPGAAPWPVLGRWRLEEE